MKTLARNIYRTIVRAATGFGLDKIGPIHHAHNALLRKLHPVSVNVFGMCLFLDEHDSLNLSIHAEHEPVLTKFIRSVVPRGSNGIDVGAHIGYFSLLLADTIGPDGNVTSLEANPTNFALLQQTVNENGLTQIVPLHRAVTEKDGTITLSVSTGDSVDHRIFSVGDREEIEVPCTSLDSVVPKNSTIDFIKMDIQGAEGFALEGMRRLIADQENLILVSEFEPWGLEESGYGAKRYTETLISLGFSLYDLNEKTGELTPTNPEILEQNYPVIKDQFTTLVAEIAQPDKSLLSKYKV